VLFAAYDVPVLRMTPDNLDSDEFHALFNAPGPAGFIVTVDPEQSYWPKIQSRIMPNGSMESAPLHLISPELPPETAAQVLRYI
jgi:acetolactate synthase-1/2/3 large subunit